MALYTLFSWLSLLLIVIPLLLIQHKIKYAKSSKLPPGPPRIPILGNLHQFGKAPHRSLWLLSRIYGPLMYLQLGRIPLVVVSSATMAREVMKIHDLEFCNRPSSLVAAKKLSYNFLDLSFVPYGQYWREMRKISVLELFSSKRVQSFGFVRNSEVSKMIQSISQSSFSSVNLSEMLLSLANNVISRAAFGKSYEGGDEHEKESFHRIMDEARTLLGGFFIADVLPQMWWMDVLTGLNARLEKNFMDLDAFYERVIDEHLDPKRPKQDQEDFVDVLIQIQQDLHLTRDHIKGVLMNVLIAGTDTSAAMMVWGMTELMRKPIAMKKVQDEVRKIVGRKEKVEESDLQHLQYLKCVVKETLRLHPPGPLLLPRETMKKCCIDGYDIPAQTRVFVNAFAIGRDPKSWERPEDFLPERFMDSSIDYKGQDFELVPFGAGRRRCPGMHLGTVIVELALANLLYSFNWEFPAGMKIEEIDMKESFGIVVLKKSALQLVPINYNNSIDGQTEE
ncbi:strychnine-11-hydroxylase-like [Tasmannia lanceolata]|uniref:strychnine-11-hydroxylase-like n=1 Tax=Tasmannia lanceolata TaxID=3420 RepID=UPI00406488A9